MCDRRNNAAQNNEEADEGHVLVGKHIISFLHYFVRTKHIKGIGSTVKEKYEESRAMDRRSDINWQLTAGICKMLGIRMQLLPTGMIPRRLYVLDELLKNANGKVDRRTLKTRTAGYTHA